MFTKTPCLSSPVHSTIRLRGGTVRDAGVLATLESQFKFRAGVFVTSIFAGAFAFGVGFDATIQSFWDNWNKGVSYSTVTCRTR